MSDDNTCPTCDTPMKVAKVRGIYENDNLIGMTENLDCPNCNQKWFSIDVFPDIRDGLTTMEWLHARMAELGLDPKETP